ncbi:MAG: MFS transporter [Pseudomonadota bacterium]
MKKTISQLGYLRAFYFFQFGALGALFPFLPLIFVGRGLSAKEISWVMVLYPISSLISPPFWGLLADTFKARVLLLRIVSFCCAGSILLLLWPKTLLGNLLATGVFCFFRAPIVSLADASAHAVLGDQRAEFAKTRVWGSVGFAIFALGLGLLHGTSRPSFLLGLTSAIYALGGLTSLFLYAPPSERQTAVFKQTLCLFRRSPMLLFLMANCIYYSAHATFDVYFGLFVRRLGHFDSFLGAAWGIGVGCEILLMLFLATPILRRFDTSSALILCSILATVRWGCFSFATSQIALLVIQSLHAFTFGLWYLSMVKRAQDQAPQHLRTSVQSVVFSFMGLGMIIGYLVGGVVFEQQGSAVLYLFASTAAAISTLLYFLMTVSAHRGRTV